MRPITRVLQDFDSGHAPAYGASKAWSIKQVDQEKMQTGKQSIKQAPYGPYAGSGNVRAGKYGIHRQFDIRAPHINLRNPLEPESPTIFKGGTFPWLKDGSSTVYINTQGCGRVGDSTICGADVIEGDDTILVGD